MSNFSIIKKEKIATIRVLDTQYDIYLDDPSSDILRGDDGSELDGVTDNARKEIVISAGIDDRYYRQTLRHEIIHAFLYESGLDTEMMHSEHGHDEQMIDWFAIMAPKLERVYHELCINY